MVAIGDVVAGEGVTANQPPGLVDPGHRAGVEYGEEVENRISTVGHGVRLGWMTDEGASRYECQRT